MHVHTCHMELVVMIYNRISEIYESLERGRHLIETKKIASEILRGNRSIFTRGFSPSGTNRHLGIRLHLPNAANPAISILFILFLFHRH